MPRKTGYVGKAGKAEYKLGATKGRVKGKKKVAKVSMKSMEMSHGSMGMSDKTKMPMNPNGADKAMNRMMKMGMR